MTTTIDHADAARAVAQAMEHTSDPEPEVPARARGPRQFSASYKAQILAEYEALDKAGEGADERLMAQLDRTFSDARGVRDAGRKRDEGGTEIVRLPRR